ncbi:hypothetical protein QR680_009391 [Steinernema hermaphroditum]|uniref:HMG box domain-containing protein n=1 Tax=Steinernema hermaphroditum TaxID=289476 RepID=A0AA39IK42_9BILA|nr:hypothetical protein QR680_009391 [Steinernema hermaphroditum]
MAMWQTSEFDRYGLLNCDCSDPDSLQPTLFSSGPKGSVFPKMPLKRKKPVGSAYSNFFRLHQNLIKQRKPDASFGEISKEIAAMWISLDDSTKTIYKRSSDLKKMEYMKQVALSRAIGMLRTMDSPGGEPLSDISNRPNLAERYSASPS